MISFSARYHDILASRPGTLALADADHSYTYAELDAAAEEVAAALRSQGIGPGQFRVIVSERNAGAFIEMLGTWKAGAAFVACEDTMPPERLAFIRQDIAAYSGTVVPAFAVYTSGSTGTPKRIVHGFGTLDLIWHSVYLHGQPIFGADTHFGFAIPLTTIAAIIAFVSCLSQGMSMYVVSAAVAREPQALAEAFARQHIQNSFLPTSLARRMPSFGPDFHRLMIGAEPRDGFAPAGIDVVDCYAMSESGYLTLVNGIPFTEGHVRVEHGEILFDNPYLSVADNPAYPTYHTQDSGRRLPDGTIQVLGRLDDQIKIGGQRIEPAEIEQAARTLPTVEDACARSFIDQDGTFIILYFTSSQTPGAAEFETAFLSQLPHVMLPLACIRLQEFPHLPHGKVDKRALATLPPAEIIPLSDDMDSLGRVFSGVRLERFTANEASIKADDAARQRALPLTLYQRFYLESELENEGGLPLNLLYEFTYSDSPWPLEDLRKAWLQALANHPAFWMILRQDGDRIYQQYAPGGSLVPAMETPQPFTMFGHHLARISFGQDEKAAPRVIFEAHHIVTDGYSLLLLAKDVQRVLTGQKLCRDFYCSAVSRICEWQAGADFACALDSYEEDDTDDWCTKLPFEATGMTGNLLATVETARELPALADVPTWKLVAAALKTLHDLTGRPKVAISYTHNGRIDGELATCCGFLLTNVPIRCEFTADTTDHTLEAAVKRQLQITRREAWCPYGSIASDNWENTGYDDDFLELYDNRFFYADGASLCAIKDLKSNASLVADTACELYINGSQPGQTYLEYNSSLYSATAMNTFLERFLAYVIS